MDDIPLDTLGGCLVALLLISAFFSLSETAMMAANRFRLRHLAQQGHPGARKAIALLEQTDRLLGVILLGNNLVNAAAATLVSVITIELFGEDKWALGMGTLAVTLAILVFSEITPKIIGASHADRLALALGHVLTPLLHLCRPAVWFVNLFVRAVMRLLCVRLPQDSENNRLSREELHSLVMESSAHIPHKHRSILSSLLELQDVTVDDVMIPRQQIEILDLDMPWPEFLEQLTTSHHSRLPVCHESLDQLVGTLPIRRLLSHLGERPLAREDILPLLQPPYYIPHGTPVFTQLAFFQENRYRLGFVVDEYGEILGLLTLEDILEEFIGDFTSTLPEMRSAGAWDDQGSIIVEGSRALRELNRQFGLNFPLDGPKTLNGLILEHFQDIPEAGISLRIGNITVEILQTRERSVVTARIFRA